MVLLSPLCGFKKSHVGGSFGGLSHYWLAIQVLYKL